ncbi:recombinase family protein, partial [Lactococcus lactis]
MDKEPLLKIGYARVSSKEQNLDRQLEALSHVS